MDIEQHFVEWTVGHWRNKGGNQRVVRIFIAVKAVLRGKFIGMRAYIKKQSNL
jgi:hypothetical protein